MHGPVAQQGLASYGAWLGCAGYKDTQKLSDVATNCPDEALNRAQSTPAIADGLAQYAVRDDALASACIQETSDCRDGNDCRLMDKAHGEWLTFGVTLETPSLHNNIQSNLTDGGELG